MWSIAFIVPLSRIVNHRHLKYLMYTFELESFLEEQAQLLSRFEKQVVQLKHGQFPCGLGLFF